MHKCISFCIAEHSCQFCFLMLRRSA